ncbi:MAG: epoxyqueuosine reductase QueH [Alphaproteobacteria bacterium]|nr:epoxyqueuosine reductase QueH [Alphaproteobacteria bacterium]
MLLSCCAPCSCAVIKTLAEQKRNFAVVFYNPNIRPYAEYVKRRDENARLCEKYKVDFIDLEYDNERWCSLTKGLEMSLNAENAVLYASTCASNALWNMPKPAVIRQ